MFFNKYVKIDKMYKENKEKLENTNISKTEIDKKIRNNKIKQSIINKNNNGAFNSRTYNNIKK